MKYFFYLILFLIASASVSGQFHKGVDLSYVNQMEDCEAVYYEDASAKDPFQTMKDHGANLVRVRLWHTPTAWDNFPTTYSSYEDVKKTIERAKSKGMNVLLDFHYSDTWADPGKQIIPEAWEELELQNKTSVLADSVYQYTYEILSRLDNLGLMPELVQVGNETNGDILRQEGDDLYPVDWDRQSTLLNAGIQGVRDAGKQSTIQPKVILHVADPNNGDWWLGEATNHGINDFDIFGMSFYPEWHDGSISDIGDIIEYLKGKYNKDMMLVETGVPWTTDWNDDADNMLNECPKGYGKVSPDCQRNWLIDMTTEVSSRGGIGMIYWEPGWVSTGCDTEWGTGSHWENAAFWDFENQLITNGGVQFLEQNYGSSNSAPTASFTYTVTDLTVDFDGSGSSDSDGTISSWDWDFGDGNTGSGELVSHTYGSSGDYTVTLTVTDDEGATDSDAQVVSVSDGSSGGDPTTMHVQSIETGTENAGQGQKHGTATVTVHDDLEDPVSTATVTGTFSGTFSETVSGETGPDGTVILKTTGTAKGKVTVDFCVDDVTHSSLTYDASQNDITCTDGSKSFLLTEEGEESVISVYPNPSENGYFLLDIPEKFGTENVTIRILNLQGKQIYQATHKKQQAVVPVEVALPEGLYLLKVSSSRFDFNTRLLIR